MSDFLNKPTVLVLNRHWQAIHVKTPAEAFCMMASDAATALEHGIDPYERRTGPMLSFLSTMSQHYEPFRRFEKKVFIYRTGLRSSASTIFLWRLSYCRR